MRNRASILRTLERVVGQKMQASMMHSGVDRVARECEANGVKQAVAFLRLVFAEDSDPAAADELMEFEQRLHDGEL